MINYIYDFIRIAIYAWGIVIAIYGWGLFVNQLSNYHTRHSVINLPIGLAILIFFGGIFNLLNIAYGWVFDSLFLAGIVINIKAKKFQLNLPNHTSEWLYLTLILIITVLIIAFTIETQFPPKAYNYHDDYEKYFVHPVRMLQTGTLFGNPLSSLGSETMGGQAVLHGIFLNHFPISHINGVDAAFGLLLCLILSVSIVPRNANFLPISLISLLMVFFINPQYVNISSCYIAAAFMMTAILLSCNYEIHKTETNEINELPPPIMMGLTYAALIALKATFIVFPIIHTIFYAIALKMYNIDIRCLVRWVILTVGLTFLFLSPWVCLYFPYYVRSSFTFHYSAISNYIEFPNLFSWNPLYYGSSFAHYTFLSLATLLFGCVFILLKRNGTKYSPHNHFAGLISSGATVTSFYLLIISLGPMLFGYETSLRYAIPYLIAGAPIVFAVACHLTMRKMFLKNRLRLVVLLLIGTFVLISFSSSLSDRIRQGYQSGSILAFSDTATNRSFLKYNEAVLYGNAELRIKMLQNKIPPGSKMIVQVSTPFYLNYERNTIYDTEGTGIANPWAYMPDAEYFILEYSGPAVRPLNQDMRTVGGKQERYTVEKQVEFLQFFQKLKGISNVIYNDGSIVILKTLSTDK